MRDLPVEAKITQLISCDQSACERFLPFDSLRSLRAGSQHGGCGAVKWMQRHVAARHDKKNWPRQSCYSSLITSLILSPVTRHSSLSVDGAAVDLGHHCRVVARGFVFARTALSALRGIFFALVDSTFTTGGQVGADHDHRNRTRESTTTARSRFAFAGNPRIQADGCCDRTGSA